MRLWIVNEDKYVVLIYNGVMTITHSGTIVSGIFAVYIENKNF